MLDAYGTHAHELDCIPRRRPTLRRRFSAASSNDEFLQISVAFTSAARRCASPMSAGLTPELQRFVRALEIVLRQRVKAARVLERAGRQGDRSLRQAAQDHRASDGRKRWFISTDPPGLQNKWAQAGEAPPNLHNHQVLDVEPGDLIYIPGGTPHTVESTTESLHLAIVFVPMTLREAIIAAVDLLWDSEREFRNGGGAHAGCRHRCTDRNHFRRSQQLAGALPDGRVC